MNNIVHITSLALLSMCATIVTGAAQHETTAVSATCKTTQHFKGDNLSKDAKEKPSSVAARSGTESNQKLRAAAEPFENLTEISFAAGWTKLDQTAVKAETAVEGARGSLSKDAAVELAARIAAMKSALQKHDRAGVALSSIESYRVLVSAVTDNAKIPTDVSLLDYAGFRYDANLKAQPIRWDEMAATVSFARKTWDTLLPRAKASPVAARFEKAITDMNKAVTQRSKSLAASSVKSELDLVDQLETFFTHPTGR